MRSVLVALLCLLASPAVGQMLLTSPAFKNLGDIPDMFCCDPVWFDDYRPSIPLEWTRPPARAQSFILVVDDLDAEGFVHWFVKDIPKDTTALPNDASEINMPTGAIELANSKGFDFYSGPCPPPGIEHSYRIRLFAMPKAHTHIASISNPRELTVSNITAQIEEEALYVAVLVGKAKLPPPPPPVDGTVPAPVNARRARRVALLQAKLGDLYQKNGTRPFIPGQQIPQTRFIKPSEALKSKKRAPVLSDDACSSPERHHTPECIIYAAELAASQNLSTNSSETSHMTHFTQWLVSQRVESFKKELELWSCDEEYKLQKGVRLQNGESSTCSLRVRVTDAPCEKPVLPRQFICAPGNDTKSKMFGLSPSLMWKDAPEGTQSLVLVMEESSAPPFVKDHGRVFWIVSDISPHVDSIEAGASGVDGKMPPLSIELKNTFGVNAYTPPCPGPHDVRNYRIRLFAMPHPKTKLFFHTPEVRGSEIVEQLQQTALCMTDTELPFSYRTSVMSHMRPAEAVAKANDDSGEIVQVE